MSVVESTRSAREKGRSLRHSSLIKGNVIAFVFRSLDPVVFSPTGRSESKSESESTKDGPKAEENCVPTKILQDFVDANKNSMNKKLVESLDEVRVVGWIAPCTLLLSGPIEDTEVLKNAWCQRLLRNPKGFLLKDIGIVKDFVIESVPHSQFISLSTALYDTVIELDRNGRCASRDTIIKYLKNVYHNVRIPSEEVIHKCLGKLIEQRKIYHDGVGYRALIDDSPVHKPKAREPAPDEVDDSFIKGSVKDSANGKSDGGSTCTSTNIGKEHRGKSDCESTSPSTNTKKVHKPKAKIRLNLSDSSKDETASKAHSDEDRHRFNLPFLDYVFNGTPLMSKKGIKEKDTSKKKKPLLLVSTGKSFNVRENENDREIKIIDISERMSVLTQDNKPSQRILQENNASLATTKNGDPFHSPDNASLAMTKNGDPFHSPGLPYDKHSRNAQPPKRPKPHRSRSFTEPSKHRLKHKQSKSTEKETDFPLRRVMGTDELRVASKRDREKKSTKNHKTKLNEKDSGTIDTKKLLKDNRNTEEDIEKMKNDNNLQKYDIIIHDKISVAKSHLKIENDFDTQSVANTSDAPSGINTSSGSPSAVNTSTASSPLQIKKRKDVSHYQLNNNIDINGHGPTSHNHLNSNNNSIDRDLACVCLTRKIQNGVNGHLIDENSYLSDDQNEVVEDDSIFDYVDSEQDPLEYTLDDDYGICTDNSLEIDYGV